MDKKSPLIRSSDNVDDLQDKLSRRLVEGLFVLTVALAVYFIIALLSYDVRDPSWSNVVGSYAVHNYAGKTGAWLSDGLFSLLGYSAYCLPLILIYRAWLFFRSRDEFDSHDWPSFLIVTIGVAFVVISLTGLLAINTPEAASVLREGNGGYLGEMLAEEFLPGFGLAGGRLVLLTLFLIGVTISTDISWIQLIERIGRFFAIWVPKLVTGIFSGRWLSSLSIFRLPFSRKLSASVNDSEQDASDDESLQVDGGRVVSTDIELPGDGASDVEKKRPSFFSRFSLRRKLDAVDTRLEPQFDAELTLNNNGVYAEVPVVNSMPAQVPIAQTYVENTPPVAVIPTINPMPKAPEPSKKALEEKQDKMFDDGDMLPSLNLLLQEPLENKKGYSAEVLEKISRLLEVRLLEFKIEAKVLDVFPGPVVTRFEIQPKPGTKASTISGLSKDLARSLAVQSVRVVEVITGKSVIGIEIPNENREMVYFGKVIGSEEFESSKSPLTMALGHDIGGQTVIADLAKMPHLLVAGTTGSGKSVGVNAMILSLLFKSKPDDVRLMLVDPKMLELSVYDDIPHLLTPVITDMKDAANGLRWCVGEMERRYKLMAKLGVRNIAGYNKKVLEAENAGNPILDPLWEAELEFMAGENVPPAPPLSKLPYIVVVIDEFADMIMVVGKKVEELIARIAQKARAAGIHLILATQRPSVDVITGLIKANVPTRIAFQVSSKIDSRTILDQGGAEQLLGHGDMLYLPPGTSMTVRVHGAFVDDDEVHAVVASWKARAKPNYIEGLIETGGSEPIAGIASDGGDNSVEEQDALYDEAVAFVCETRKASISSVQRKLRIGYNRAARMIEAMEAAGVVSAMSGSGQREVLAPPAVSPH